MHDLGPEIRRAISGNLEDEEIPDMNLELEEPMHRVKQPPDGAVCVPWHHFDRLFVRAEALYRHAWTARVAGINYLPCVCVISCI